MIGNAHLDLAWLWPWQEGFGEVKATFLSALQRIEEFDEFIFTSSSAQYYAWVEENAPDLFARIREQVKKGRWIICGGWWVQPDCNLPGGESFVRQGLYGQQYFQSRFGITASVGYNVDSFGHNAGLPQILRKSGMDSYLFLRPGEREMELPTGPFCWQGVDGSSVTACRIPVSYSSIISLEGQIQDALDRFPETDRDFICFYGVGNHGGGPTIDNILHILAHVQVTEECRLVFSDPRKFFDAVASRKDSLPVIGGELQHHAPGCYSVVSRLKQLNRQAEHALPAAEIYSVLAKSLCEQIHFPCALEGAWQQLLTCQFHDILAGSSTREVCEDAEHILGGVLYSAAETANHAVQAISFSVDIPYGESCQPLVVFNPHSFPVETVIYHEKGSWGNFSFPEPCQVLNSAKEPVPFQFVHLKAQLDERKRIAFLAKLPPLGYETFRITAAEQAPVPTGECPENVLENELVRVELDEATGLISSYYHKGMRRELLAAPSGYFLAHEDFSDTWGHGESCFDGRPRVPELLSMVRLEQGEVLQRIQVLFRLGGSRLRQIYTLRRDAAFLEVEVEVNWQEQYTCLKLYHAPAIREPEIFWETPFGAIRRSASGQEEPLQSWVDLSADRAGGENWGMAFAVCGIGGAHVRDGVIGLTLLRSPVYVHHAPHVLEEGRDIYEYTDQGIRRLQYRVIPHEGRWQDSGIVRESLLLNLPVTKIVETFHKGNLPQRFGGMEINAENVLLSCLKEACDGDGVILRLRESSGERTRVRILLTLLKDCIETEFGPYEVKTWRLRPGQKPEECLMTEFPLRTEKM